MPDCEFMYQGVYRGSRDGKQPKGTIYFKGNESVNNTLVQQIKANPGTSFQDGARHLHALNNAGKDLQKT